MIDIATIAKSKEVQNELTGYVTAFAMNLAHQVCRDGVEAQVKFLKDNGYTDEQVNAFILRNLLQPGWSVEVAAHMDNNGYHHAEFTGFVRGVTQHYVTVLYPDGEGLDVPYEYIESFKE